VLGLGVSDPSCLFRCSFAVVVSVQVGSGAQCALSSVYTFGPRSGRSTRHTTRHLAEFWMIEPEIAFADLEVCEPMPLFVGFGFRVYRSASLSFLL